MPALLFSANAMVVPAQYTLKIANTDVSVIIGEADRMNGLLQGLQGGWQGVINWWGNSHLSGEVDPQEFFGTTDSAIWHGVEIVESNGATLATRLATEGEDIGSTIFDAIGIVA